MRDRKENKMKLKTVKIGLANASYITIPYEKISVYQKNTDFKRVRVLLTGMYNAQNYQF